VVWPISDSFSLPHEAPVCVSDSRRLRWDFSIQLRYIGLILFELVRSVLHGMTVLRLSAKLVSDRFLFELTIHGLVLLHNVGSPLRFEGENLALLVGWSCFTISILYRNMREKIGLCSSASYLVLHVTVESVRVLQDELIISSLLT
jgi:hypothetical protein